MVTERAKRVAIYAVDGGFRDKAVADAIAIALAESGGNPKAGAGRTADRDRPRPGCGSWGLWQINSCPDRDGDGPPRFGSSPEVLLDPRVNARAAYVISSGGADFGPWSTWWQDPARKRGPGQGKVSDHRDEANRAYFWLGTDDADRLGVELIGRPVSAAVKHRIDYGDPASVWDGVRQIIEHPGDVIGGLPGAAADTARGVLGQLGDLVAVLGGLARFVELLTQWDTWRRVLYVVVALVLLVAAAALLGADLNPARRLAAGRTGD